MREELRPSQGNGNGNAPPAAAAAAAADTVMNPNDEGAANLDDDLVELQSRSRLRASGLPQRIFDRLPDEVKARLVDDKVFLDACDLATADHRAAAGRLAEIAGSEPNTMVEFANICVTGPVGMVGRRRCLRATAVELLDMVLEKQPDFVKALCLKGDINMPRTHYGKGDPDTPAYVLIEALRCFTRACQLGSREGKFLKGRWLVTMAKSHKSDAKGEEGKALVLQAANEGSARALLFIAQAHEFPGRFGRIKFPVEEATKAEEIVKLYMKAAQLGDPDALNDVGSSYATGYGPLKQDFDLAVKFYVRAIRAGSLEAFDNLGTHYETGMSDAAPERIDLVKAAYYYRAGARMRCPNCAANLASAYDDGMKGVIEPQPQEAEAYYRYAILLADDMNQPAMASRALKDLISLYIARLKLNAPGSDAARDAEKKISKWLNQRMAAGTLTEVNRKLAASVKEGICTKIAELIGDNNGAKVFRLANNIVEQYKARGIKETDRFLEQRMAHLFGASKDDVVRFISKPPTKRRRITD